jgi:hypothetical protein
MPSDRDVETRPSQGPSLLRTLVWPLLFLLELPKAVERPRLALRGRDGSGARGPAFFGDDQVFSASAAVIDVALHDPRGVAASRLTGQPAWTW